MDLRKCMLDIEADDEMPQWSSETIDKGHPLRMPNPDRALAEGDPIYTSFIDVFGDDVSGNRSKAGTSIGISISLTGTCHGSFSTNKFIHTLYRHRHMQVSLNNSMESSV